MTTKDDNRVDFDKLWQKISKGVGQLSEKDKGLGAVKRVYRAEDNFDAAAKVPLEEMPGARRKAKRKGDRKMKLSEFISRMRAIQDDMYDGGKPSVEELIELSRPQCLGLHLLTEQELEVMIEGINDGLSAIEKAYLYFDDE